MKKKLYKKWRSRDSNPHPKVYDLRKIEKKNYRIYLLCQRDTYMVCVVILYNGTNFYEFDYLCVLLVCVFVCVCVCINKLDEIDHRISGIIASFLEVFVLHAKIMNSNLRCAPVFVHYYSM